jgi:SHAQKYF class myb-like DNA-binding protein
MTQTSNSSPARNSPHTSSTNNNNSSINEINTQQQQQQSSSSYANYGGHQQNSPLAYQPQQQQQQPQYYGTNHTTMGGSGGSGGNMYYPQPSTGKVAQSFWGGNSNNNDGSNNYDHSGLSLTIPPPYAFTSEASPQYTNTNTTSDDPTGQRSMVDSIVNNIAIGLSGSNSGGRPVRTKRTAAAAGLNQDLTAGYDSSADGNSSGRGPGTNKVRRKGGKGRSGTGNTRGSGKDGKNQNPGGQQQSDEKNDGRWSKRFTWPDDLHRDFVSAIFDVGLKHASPSTVMEHMPPHEQITTERIKSHLQKYRIHRQKAKREFMTSYQATMDQINAEGGIHNITSLASGQVAAHLSYASENLPDPDIDNIDGANDGTITNDNQDNPSNEEAKYEEEVSNDNQILPASGVLEEPTQDVFFLPKLTEVEKVSPIGLSLGYLMGLFFTLRQQLDAQRRERVEYEDAHRDAGQDMQDEFANVQTGPISSTTNTLQNQITVSSSRSNLEANTLMKRDMQSQMAFQNKMRALKQQELNKYSKVNADGSQVNNDTGLDADHEPINSIPIGSMNNDSQQIQHRRGNKKQLDQQGYSGAGETGGVDTAMAGRDHSASTGDEDEFWNTSVVDDELFDFLMNS